MKPKTRILVALFSALLGLGLALPAFGRDPGQSTGGDPPHITLPSHGFGLHVDPDSGSPAITSMPRGGSFGGGGRSFGGGGGFGGGGFGGGSRSSGSGSFGGGSRSFGGSNSSPRSSNSVGSSSFGRSGTMGSSGPTRSTSISPGPRGTSNYYYGGRNVYGYGGGYWGGYSYGWFHPAWYYYTPFYPAFYFSPPYADSMGYYHAGGFSFGRLIAGMCCCPLVFVGIIWLFSKSFGGGKRIKYTTYK